MCSRFNDFTVFQHMNNICILNGRQTVGNNDDSPLKSDPVAMASMTFSSEIFSSELVASSRRRISGPLIITRAIATRWRWPPDRLHPLVSDNSIVSFRSFHDEFMGICHLRSLYDCFFVRLLPEKDIIPDAPWKINDSCPIYPRACRYSFY